MRNRLILCFSVLLIPAGLAQTTRSRQTTRNAATEQLVERALGAMGGPGVVERARIIKTEESRLSFHLQDSEHSLPPYLPDYGTTTQWIDFAIPAFRTDSSIAMASGDLRTLTQIARKGFSISRSIFNGKPSGQRVGVEPPRWTLQNPLLALLRASRSHDLQELDPQALFGIEHRRVEFKDGGYKVTLWINRFNDHLDAVDVFGTDRKDMFWNEWGDVTLRTVYSDWHFEAGGLHYPHQWNIYFNGDLQETRSIRRLTVSPDMSKTDMSVPEEGRPTDSDKNTIDDFPFGRSDRPIVEIAPGIVQIPGNWYVTLVKQADGIVVIDAPISNGYSVKVIEEAGRRFPGMKIKGVIASTNFWWHIAGLREYAARGIPVFVPDQNVALIRRLLTSPHALAPDSLEKSQKKPDIIGVGNSRSIGGGENRLILYPIRTATAQMMMTWFPEKKILHTAEMAQPLGPNESFLFPESLLELKRAVDAKGLRVDAVIGMHMNLTSWSKVIEALDSAAENGEIS